MNSLEFERLKQLEMDVTSMSVTYEIPYNHMLSLFLIQELRKVNDNLEKMCDIEYERRV